MPINANILSGIRPVQIQNPAQGRERRLRLRDLIQRVGHAEQMAPFELERAEYLRDKARTDAETAPALAALEWQDKLAELTSKELETETKKTMEFGRLMAASSNEPSYQRNLQTALDRKLIEQDHFLRMQNVRFSPGMVKGFTQKALEASEWMTAEHQRKQREETHQKNMAAARKNPAPSGLLRRFKEVFYPGWLQERGITKPTAIDEKKAYLSSKNPHEQNPPPR